MSGYELRPGLWIPEREVWFEFSHAGGPGGQNVNKVATAATLCFHPASSGVLSDSQKALVALKLANRINQDGVLRVASDSARTQPGNRALAAARFAELLSEALKPIKKRRPTRPSRASVERRLSDKRIRSARKMGRRDAAGDGEGD